MVVHTDQNMSKSEEEVMSDSGSHSTSCNLGEESIKKTETANVEFIPWYKRVTPTWDAISLTKMKDETYKSLYNKYTKENSDLILELDKVVGIPIVGATFVIEVRSDDDPYYYICVLCEKKCCRKNVIDHLKTLEHITNYCNRILNKISCKDIEPSDERAMQKFLDKLVEHEYMLGRGRFAVSSEFDLPKVINIVSNMFLHHVSQVCQSFEKPNVISKLPTFDYNSNTTILVGNLPCGCTIAEIYDKFFHWATINAIRMIGNFSAVVIFSKPVQLYNNHTLHGNKLKITKCLREPEEMKNTICISNLNTTKFNMINYFNIFRLAGIIVGFDYQHTKKNKTIYFHFFDEDGAKNAYDLFHNQSQGVNKKVFNLYDYRNYGLTNADPYCHHPKFYSVVLRNVPKQWINYYNFDNKFGLYNGYVSYYYQPNENETFALIIVNFESEEDCGVFITDFHHHQLKVDNIPISAIYRPPFAFNFECEKRTESKSSALMFDNISSSVSEDDLMGLLIRYGDIDGHYWLQENRMALVKFASIEDAVRAKEFLSTNIAFASEFSIKYTSEKRPTVTVAIIMTNYQKDLKVAAFKSNYINEKEYGDVDVIPVLEAEEKTFLLTCSSLQIAIDLRETYHNNYVKNVRLQAYYMPVLMK